MIKRSKRPARKSARQTLVLEADAWVRAIVVNRQLTPCLRQGMNPPVCGGGIQGAHILRKGGMYVSIRHNLDNVVGLCTNHHMYWAHIYEHDFYEWIEKLFPGRIAALKEEARFRRKTDLKELICVLKFIAKKEHAV